MNVIEEHYYLKDHQEALVIERQLKLAPVGTTSNNIMDLNQFCDCCEDGVGYTVAREDMDALAKLGLVIGGRRGYFELTELGSHVRDGYYDKGDHPL